MAFTTSLSNWSVLCEMFQNALSLLQHAPLCFNETKAGDCLHTAFNTLPPTSTPVKHAHAEGMKGNSSSVTLFKMSLEPKARKESNRPKRLKDPRSGVSKSVCTSKCRLENKLLLTAWPEQTSLWLQKGAVVLKISVGQGPDTHNRTDRRTGRDRQMDKTDRQGRQQDRQMDMVTGR